MGGGDGGDQRSGGPGGGTTSSSRPAPPRNAKRRRFALEYLKDLNATEAAKRAGYSLKTAYAQGSRLLKDAEIRAFIDAKVDGLEQRAFLNVADLERELHRLAFFDPAKLYDEHGLLRPVTELDEDTRRALVGVEVEELFQGRGENREKAGYLRKVRWHNKREAIELALKRRGALVERIDVTHHTHADLVEEAAKQASNGHDKTAGALQ